MKVALYARISTSDDRQTLANQIGRMTDFARAQQWTIAHTFNDQDSGAKEKRPGLLEMLDAARRGEFEAIVIFSLSRLTRGGPARAFAYIDELQRAGVTLYSVAEPHFTTAGRAGALFIAIAAHIAEEERRLIQERVNAGIARAKRQGIKFGRPKAKVDPEKLLALIDSDKTHKEIARELNISLATYRRIRAKTYEKRGATNHNA